MVEPMVRPRRSLLFVPGTRLDRAPKAIAAGADVVCIDLEDAVAPAAKDAARGPVFAWFADPLDFAGELLVRINGLRSPGVSRICWQLRRRRHRRTGCSFPRSRRRTRWRWRTTC